MSAGRFDRTRCDGQIDLRRVINPTKPCDSRFYGRLYILLLGDVRSDNETLQRENLVSKERLVFLLSPVIASLKFS